MHPISDITSIIPNPPPMVKGVTHLSLADRNKLWQSAQGLESTFSMYLLKDLKVGAEQGDGKQSFAADTYGDMFKQAMVDQMARSGSMGLARQIYIDAAKTAEKSLVASQNPPPSQPGPIPSPVNPLLPTSAKTGVQPKNTA